jgi:hypothetical protein
MTHTANTSFAVDMNIIVDCIDRIKSHPECRKEGDRKYDTKCSYRCK